MKVLVTGYNGQLGFDVIQALEKRQTECRGTTREDFDLTDAQAMRTFVEGYQPDVVIHCAAYTAVDKAEDEEVLCRQVNVVATRNLAEICRDIGAKMVYISTDYVFPGDGDLFYEPEAPKAPQNVYGKTKLEGELAVQELLPEHFIVRISWVFGSHGNNFVKTMLRLGAEQSKLLIVKDQIGSPSYTVDLAELLCDMVETEKYGVYHASNEGVCSWAEFAAEIFRQAQMEVRVLPITASERPSKAARPANSRLSKKCLDAAGFSRLPHWSDAIGRYLKELGKI